LLFTVEQLPLVDGGLDKAELKIPYRIIHSLFIIQIYPLHVNRIC